MSDERMVPKEFALEGSDAPGRRFSREDLDRVIRRAAELQLAEEGGGGDLVPEEELLRIGGEVGLEGRHLRRAIGELRAESLRPGVPSDEGVLTRIVGSGVVQVSRVVPGRADEVEHRLEEHLRVGESLTRVRKRGGRSLWEPASGVMAEVQRALRWRGFRYDLAKAGSVELTLSMIEEGYALVTMTADLRKSRRETGVGWIAGTTLGMGAGGAALGVAIGVPLIGVPTAALGTLIGMRAGREQVRKALERIRLSMEGILDRLEGGEPLARRSGRWNDRLRP